MNLFNILFEWACDDGSNSIKPIFHLVKVVLDIIRIVVPIGLIFMTTMDITKKVINPEDKDGQKKIMVRAIAALIVFLVPMIVRLSFKLIDWGNGKNNDPKHLDETLSDCWDKA